MKYYKYEGQALRNIPNEVEGRGLRKYCKILYFKTKQIVEDIGQVLLLQVIPIE